MRGSSVMVALSVAFLAVGNLALANTYTVTSTADTGAGSLRQAILDANASAGLDTIAFNVSGAGCDGAGVCTIAPTSTSLPVFTSPVLVDGYTQPGSSPNTNPSGAINAVLKIVISGVNVPGSYAFNLSTGSDGSTLRGLVINGGFNYTISMSGPNGAVRGCFVGTNAAGTAAVPNQRGVYSNGTGSTIGGPLPADRNLIAGNHAQEIWDENTPNLTIEGNLVGTDSSGTALIGALSGGVISSGRAGGVIRGNVVGGSHTTGIFISSGTDFGTLVQGNFIGTDVTGTVNLGNTTDGIFIDTKQVTIGGINAGEGNVIAFNKGAGVFLDYTSLGTIRQNPIRGNSIYSNHQDPNALATQGIDLGESSGGFGAGGLTPNDPGDADIGPNDFQNFPIVSSATPALPTSGTHVVGTLRSMPSTTFDLDFYSNPACIPHPHDYVEGRTYLGSSQVTTDGTGKAAIDVTLAPTIQPGERVSATATDPSGNTSEFSQRMPFSISPASGAASGGAGVTITGTDFVSGATVTIGGVAATGVNVSDYHTITATAPALPAGSLNDVVVTDSDGTSGTLEKGFVADFLDVPPSEQFYSYVSTLVTNAITVGVGGGNYGVDQSTLRQQMAVFLLKARHGLCYTPPPCTGVFPDVPCPSTFADWIEALAAEAITGGCGGGNYCPTSPVLRQQMAVFLLKAEHGSSYVPPPCTGVFLDVPCPSTFADWIEQLAAEMITGGCGGGNYCPTNPNTRGQMAVFIVKTFQLQ